MIVFEILKKDFGITVAICKDENAIEKWFKQEHKDCYPDLSFEEFKNSYFVLKTEIFS